ncbi:hypothetical protein Cob_v007949 [Colletotrichum orbiculare MAFF 240422]|uniref:Uncharacterized protein n=1 Tax=Colletotrichum orbiculare (strain 104-T / ATCC 96160 / CBS 514.97 / LARS 414 / MAFF 240422) TaxID=1213857 RepID=N4VRU7_COLOR|nr:hypothetical protein Cob_v007949 [Colletotrichum orbiculare MAFF 240422]
MSREVFKFSEALDDSDSSSGKSDTSSLGGESPKAASAVAPAATESTASQIGPVSGVGPDSVAKVDLVDSIDPTKTLDPTETLDPSANTESAITQTSTMESGRTLLPNQASVTGPAALKPMVTEEASADKTIATTHESTAMPLAAAGPTALNTTSTKQPTLAAQPRITVTASSPDAIPTAGAQAGAQAGLLSGGTAEASSKTPVATTSPAQTAKMRASAKQRDFDDKDESTGRPKLQQASIDFARAVFAWDTEFRIWHAQLRSKILNELERPVTVRNFKPTSSQVYRLVSKYASGGMEEIWEGDLWTCLFRNCNNISDKWAGNRNSDTVWLFSDVILSITNSEAYDNIMDMYKLTRGRKSVLYFEPIPPLTPVDWLPPVARKKRDAAETNNNSDDDVEIVSHRLIKKAKPDDMAPATLMSAKHRKTISEGSKIPPFSAAPKDKVTLQGFKTAGTSKAARERLNVPGPSNAVSNRFKLAGLSNTGTSQSKTPGPSGNATEAVKTAHPSMTVTKSANMPVAKMPKPSVIQNTGQKTGSRPNDKVDGNATAGKDAANEVVDMWMVAAAKTKVEVKEQKTPKITPQEKVEQRNTFFEILATVPEEHRDMIFRTTMLDILQDLGIDVGVNLSNQVKRFEKFWKDDAEEGQQ